jgi:hypothetical protein
MGKGLVLGALAFVPLLLGAGTPAEKKSETPRYSRERLEQIRNALSAQIAVRDKAEQAMRTPTAAEAAALANRDSATNNVVPLASGGVALRMDPSQLTFLVVEKGEDGKLKLSHASASAAGKAGKGAANAR